MLYPQNGDRIVTTDSVTSLHPVYVYSRVLVVRDKYPTGRRPRRCRLECIAYRRSAEIGVRRADGRPEVFTSVGRTAVSAASAAMGLRRTRHLLTGADAAAAAAAAQHRS